MKVDAGKLRQLLVAGAVLVSVVLAALHARAIDKEAYEAQLLAELQKVDPESVEPFRKANQAREARDLQGASALYDTVRKRVPGFSAAARRQCGVEAELGHRDSALKLCREALRTENRWENKSALAGLLLQAPEGLSRPTATDLAEALRLSGEALRDSPEDPSVNLIRCQAHLYAQDRAGLEVCSRRLRVVAPKEPATHVFAALSAASEGRFDEALEEVEQAHRLGLPKDEYDHLRSAIQKGRPLTDTILPYVVRGGIGWLGGLLVLLGLGALLSKATLASISRLPATQDGAAAGWDSRLRGLYRIVLWVCCAYYYVSLPIVMLLVLAAGGGAIYAFIALGRIPVKLILVLALVVLVTAWAMLKSLFVRGKDEDPGERVALDEHPRLRDTLKEVADRIGTRMVDKVYMTPGVEVAVFERGGVLRQLAGRGERCLILGAGALEGMSVLELKSVLAHEYGHFQNEDTAGGGFALAVRRSLLVMALSLAQGGAANWYNPAWLFLQAFYKIFLRISQGASRLQEVLADRWSAFTYGSRAFEQGFLHVLRRTVHFDHHIGRTVHELVESKRGLANLYSYAPAENPEAESSVESAIQEALHRKPSPYDSHPAPADRLALVKSLGAEGKGAAEGDEDPAWSLFSSREALERKMTLEVLTQLSVNHGIHIASTG